MQFIWSPCYANKVSKGQWNQTFWQKSARNNHNHFIPCNETNKKKNNNKKHSNLNSSWLNCPLRLHVAAKANSRHSANKRFSLVFWQGRALVCSVGTNQVSRCTWLSNTSGSCPFNPQQRRPELLGTSARGHRCLDCRGVNGRESQGDKYAVTRRPKGTKRG